MENDTVRTAVMLSIGAVTPKTFMAKVRTPAEITPGKAPGKAQ